MKAVVLDQRGEQGARLRDFPDPVPARGESVMRVVAAGHNRVDLYVRDSGAGITQTLPLVMGVEGRALLRGVLQPLSFLPRRRSAALRNRSHFR
jgi:NADPH:quinone reductase-like Zn-dependent oxidoreductase